MSFATTGAATFSGDVVIGAVADLIFGGTSGADYGVIDATGTRIVWGRKSTVGAAISQDLANGHFRFKRNGGIYWSGSTTSSEGGGLTAAIISNAAGVVSVQNGAGADAALTCSAISASNALFYKVNTSATSYEALQIDATGDASNFDIAASIGSAGGTARGIRIGGKNAAGTFTSWLTFATTGAATFASSVTTTSSISCGGVIRSNNGNGVLLATNGSFTAGTRLQNLGVDGKLRIANFAATGGGYLDTTVADTFVFRNLADSAAATINAGDLTCLPSASRTLATNGQFTIERVSNTEINFVYRGDDGTTRRSALTFS
jgi:hypothetical protein